MNKNANYQDEMLNAVRKSGKQIIIVILGGSNITGIIKAFDNYVILIEVSKKLQMVYKHSIVSIVPSENISIKNIIDSNNCSKKNEV